MTTKIKDIHDQVFNFLYRKKSEDGIYFMVRQNKDNKHQRLQNGYWFRGDDNYLVTSFWSTDSGPDSIYSISFTIRFNVESCLYLSAHNKKEYHFFEKIASKITGLNKVKDTEWEKTYKGKNYLTHLESFLRHEKPLIDKLILKYKPSSISILGKEQNKHIMKINYHRSKLFGAENKIARLCWNNNGWRYPSGLIGKNIEERNNDFCLEEWLFDDNKIIEGYKYGYLKPIERLKDRKDIYNISLYSIHSSGTRYYVGEIIEAECITEKKAREIYGLYRNNGWLKDMKEDVEYIGGDADRLYTMNPGNFVNIKYKFKNVVTLEEPEEIDPSDANITDEKYVLYPKRTYKFKIKTVDTKDIEDDSLKNTDMVKRVFKGEQEYSPRHNIMQNILYRILTKQYNDLYKDVNMEDNWVDITAKTHNRSWHFYELKTYNPKLSIRRALGQLMEYVYYPNHEKAEKLIIVSDREPNLDIIIYLGYLRNRFDIPVYYRYIDIKQENLSKEY